MSPLHHLLLIIFLTTSSQVTRADICDMRPRIQDLVQYISPNTPRLIGAVMNDTLATFYPKFQNSYPVIQARGVELRYTYPKLYAGLKAMGQDSLKLEALTRTSATPSNNQMYHFYIENPGDPKRQVTFTANDKGEMKGQPAAIQEEYFLQEAARVEAAEYNTYIVTMMNDSDHQLLVHDAGSWLSFNYSVNETYPTGLVELWNSRTEVTFIVLFDTVYGFYTYPKPLREVIRLERGQRHFDNRRLMSCPVSPCHDFKVDAAFLSHKTSSLILLSGLHAYLFPMQPDHQKLPPADVMIRDLDSLNVELLKRVDAAFTAHDADGQELLFFFVNEDLITNRMLVDQDGDKIFTKWNDAVKVGSVFKGIKKIDAAVCIARQSKNLVWLFHGDRYYQFVIPGAGLKERHKNIGPFDPVDQGSISRKWPGLPTPVHAGMPIVSKGTPRARMIVDNWFYEITLSGSKAGGPMLMQDHLFLCTDKDYEDSSFNVLGIRTHADFREYITIFTPVATAASRSGAQNDYVLYGLIAFAILIVLISISICIWMWKQSHREKTKGFTATKNKFRYDYD